MLWTILHKDTVSEEMDYLLAAHPKRACHDDINLVFVENYPEAVNPILVSDMVDEEGVQLEGDDLIAAIASELFADDRTRGIQGTKGQLSQLHKSPQWRLWCGKYEDKADLEKDHEAVFSVGVDRRKSMETLVEESRVTLKAVLA